MNWSDIEGSDVEGTEICRRPCDGWFSEGQLNLGPPNGAGWQPDGLRRQEERRLQCAGPRTPNLPTKSVTVFDCNFVEAEINQC